MTRTMTRKSIELLADLSYLDLLSSQWFQMTSLPPLVGPDGLSQEPTSPITVEGVTETLGQTSLTG